ncbi:MAG: hypothetical protein WCI74_03130 [Actinomycetes bacterium]
MNRTLCLVAATLSVFAATSCSTAQEQLDKAAGDAPYCMQVSKTFDSLKSVAASSNPAATVTADLKSIQTAMGPDAPSQIADLQAAIASNSQNKQRIADDTKAIEQAILQHCPTYKPASPIATSN